MMPFIFNDATIFLLKNIAKVVIEKSSDVTIEYIIPELNSVKSDLQNVKNNLTSFTKSFVIQAIDNFNDALEHLQVPLNQMERLENDVTDDDQKINWPKHSN